ncbi:MAG: HNH endonuclease family protein [Actinomycetota bacterium]|nr:HNH endonuclease family protein [Actinomycetota bacterium]
MRRSVGGGARGRRTTTIAARSLVLSIASVLVLAASCGPVGGGGGSADTSSEALKELEVAEPGSMSGYSRESFKHWSRANDFGWDAPETSCDAREAALIRDGENVEVGSGCKVTSGSWYDPYTTNTYTDPQEIDIDHVVPLANAYRSGASSWSDEERQRYANDPDVLLSVEDDANQQKGDKGPEAWKPPNEDEYCDYAQRWISIKSKYDLTVNADEKAELEDMLGACT